MEREESAKWVATTLTRQDKPFVRNATSGSWKTVLPKETVAYIEMQWGRLMQHLGYELATSGLEKPSVLSPLER
jgi:hypothetical protein